MADVDQYLEKLFKGELISENEVKTLCQKLIEAQLANSSLKRTLKR